METPKSDCVEEGSVSKFLNNWLNGSQQLLMTAKLKLLGENYWIPSDDKEIVHVPHLSLKSLIRLREGDPFSICRSDYTSGTLYHILMKWKNAERLSVVRAKSMEDIIHDFNGLVVFGEIFRLIDHVRDVKTLTSLVSLHPSWRPVHIAAKMGLRSFFENAKKNNTLDRLMYLTSQPEQQCPLHIAIENNNVDLVVYMLANAHFPLSTTDMRGQNALHYAANTSSQMVQVLCENEESKACMNRLNNDGYTPLFLAITYCRPSCISAFVKQGAILNMMCHGRSPLHEAMLQNNNKVKDMIKTITDSSPEVAMDLEPETGNTALHLATNKLSLSAFLELCGTSVNINVVNKAGRTALHCHAFRGDLGCVICLATHDANLNAQDAEGNTTLHIAVFNGYVDLVKALLLLGCDPNIVNNDGYSCRHLAGRSKHKLKHEIIHCLLLFEAKPCTDSIGCSSLCVDEKIDADKASDVRSLSCPDIMESSSPVSVSRPSAYDEYMQQRAIEAVKQKCRQGQKVQVLLCLDGGGIRGLILCTILKYIEKELGEPISDYVDWAAGTSTGSFLAAGLALGKPLERCQHLYLRFKDQLFEGWTRPYNSERLERSLKTEMGEDTKMSDCKKFKLMITATLADKQPVRFYAFRSYKLPTVEPDQEEYTEVPVWKALRCSSAAPTYFSVVDKKFVDGGLTANNPTTELLTEIHRFNAVNSMKENNSDIIHVGCVLSIGTGRVPDIPVDNLNVSTSSPVESMSALRNLSILLVDQVTATEGLPVERARAWCHDVSVPYFRFSTPLSREYVLDTKDDKDVVQMMWETAEYMTRMKFEIVRAVELLKFFKTISRPEQRSPQSFLSEKNVHKFSY